MKIAHIIPGFGGMYYCGNCLRDTEYLKIQEAMGHEVYKIPIYMPLNIKEHNRAENPVFYGAISVYLKQNYPLFRKAPAFFDRLLHSKKAFKIAARMSGSSNAKGLEDLTISMLKGENGQQRFELKKMIDWMLQNTEPDIIHISNALLLGMAPELKRRLKVPVVCSLQDEDIWINAMESSYQKTIWQLLQEKAKEVDLFIGVSEYYAAVMQQQLDLPDNKLKCLSLGLDPNRYHFRPANQKPKNIGFLSRMNADNGFDILVDAFIELHQTRIISPVSRLILAGGFTKEDRSFIQQQKNKLAAANLVDRIEILNGFHGKEKDYFFDQVAVLSVPVRNGEAFGLYLLEAMASGTAVVQPSIGGFTEIISQTGGGITYFPRDTHTLAARLSALLNDDQTLQALSIKGRKAIEGPFHVENIIRKTIQLYEQLLQNRLSPSKHLTV